MSSLVSIVGFGRVGRSLAFLLGSRSAPICLNVVDPFVNLGAYEDILHSCQTKGFELVLNDHELLAKSDVIFHCAGPSVPSGASRLSVTRESLRLTEAIFANLAPGSAVPLIVVLANPVDLVCLQAYHVTKIDPGRIVGTGTLLDTCRFNSLMDRELNLPSGTAEGIVLGEHGESMSLWLGGSVIDGKPLSQCVPSTTVDSVMSRTRQMAQYIKNLQGATFYGVSRCALRIWDAFRAQKTEILPVSIQVEPDYRASWDGEPFWMSLPCNVGRGKIHPITLPSDARLALDESARRLRVAWENSQ